MDIQAMRQRVERAHFSEDDAHACLDALAACESRLVRYKAVAEAATRVVVLESRPDWTERQNREVWQRAKDLRAALAALDEDSEERG